jgi:CheY-like chemotaxis protein
MECPQRQRERTKTRCASFSSMTTRRSARRSPRASPRPATRFGQADDGQAGVESALELRPDIVITNWDMPVLSGIEATRQIRANAPEVVVIALASTADAEVRDAFLGAGAAASIDKKDKPAYSTPSEKSSAAGGKPSSRRFGFLDDSDFRLGNRQHEVVCGACCWPIIYGTARAARRR